MVDQGLYGRQGTPAPLSLRPIRAENLPICVGGQVHDDVVTTKRRPNRHGVRLEFSQIDCRCGTRRVRGVACPDCGAMPDQREVDPATTRRRAAVHQARVALYRKDLAAAVDLDPRAAITAVQQALGHFIQGLNEALDAASTSPEALVALAAELNTAIAIARGATRLRPWIVVLDLLTDVAETTRSCLDLYLDACAASTPRAASEAAQGGQAILNRLSEMAAPLLPLLDMIEDQEATHPPDLVTALARTITSIRPVAGILEHEAAGAAIFEEITARTGCPTGLGIMLEFLRHDTTVTGDPGRFIATARAVHSQLVSDVPRLTAVLDDPEWRVRMRQASVDLFNDSTAAVTLVAAAVRDEQCVKAVVDYVHDIVEAGSRPLIDLLVVCVTGRSLAKVQHQHATVGLQHLREHGHEDWILGLSKLLRDAKAHRTYRVEPDALTVSGRDGVQVATISYPELADLSLAAGETTAILMAATLCAATIAGDIEDLFGSADLIPPLSKVEACAILHGLSVVDIEMVDDGEKIILKLDDLLDVHHATGAVYMTAKMLPESVKVMQIAGSDGQRLEVPLETVRAWHPDRDESHIDVGLLSCFRKVHLDGKELVDRDSFRAMIARQAAPSGSPDVRDLPRLRQLRLAAEQDGDDELVTALRAFATAIRLSTTNGQLTPMEQRAVTQLASFVRLPVTAEILNSSRK